MIADTHTPRSPGRLLAWAALAVALVASVAANVAYARPAVGPRLSSSVAPILVILAAGLLERVPLAGVQRWRRLLAYLGLGVVIGAAFVTSFEHQFALLLRYGNTPLSSALLPIAVDGLIVLASVCLTVIAERQRSAQSERPAVRGVEGEVSAQPVFTPEPVAQPAADEAQNPSTPAQSRPAAQPQVREPRSAPRRRAKRPAKRVPVAQRHPLRDEVEARILAGETDLRTLHASLNGEAPSLRSMQNWAAELREAQPRLVEVVKGDA